jgi:hypothetical protein
LQVFPFAGQTTLCGKEPPQQGRIQDFKLGGALKKIAPSGGRRENFGVFCVKNHDFTAKNLIYSPLGSAPAQLCNIFVVCVQVHNLVFCHLYNFHELVVG